MANPRLLIEDTLGPGVEIALEEGRARHVGTVLRLKSGDALRVFNARDGEWRARINAQSKRGVSVRVEDFLREAAAPRDLDLLFAPVKRHATDLIVEKATELGVARLRPVITQRTIAETVRVERLALIAREAAEQTERCDVPEVCAPVALAKIVDGWDTARPLLYADESGDDDGAAWGGDMGRAAPLLQMVQSFYPSPDRGEGREGGRAEQSALAPPPQHPARPPPIPLPQGGGDANSSTFQKLALLIGPEGGFAPEERRMLRGLDFVVPVSLGPRILRAETAAIAALAVIQAEWGDWRV